MSDYSAEIVREVFPHIFHGMGSGASKRERGMPSNAGDPRNATTPYAVLADVRWSWATCEWMTNRQAQAVLLTACPWVDAVSAEILGVAPSTYSEMVTSGFHEMANWLNATPAQREARYVPA